MPDAARTLSRYRVRLGFLGAAAALWLAKPTLRTVAIGAAIAIAGELLRVWAAGHLEKGKEVTVSGPYRLTRHPLYAGSAIMGVGLAVAANTLATSILVLAYLVATVGAAIRSEETHLTEKFGSAYPDYREGRLPHGVRRFSIERAMRNREYRSMTGLAVAIAVLLWKALYR
jgi:protein-S-isoprenylcysteine O-methyltransferase Ste14